MNIMKYSAIKWNDIANGPGIRTSVFVSGCRWHCPECFNSEAWDFNHGKEFDESMIRFINESLDSPFISGLTILGGEPMEPENQKSVLDLILSVREKYGNTKSIWIYTGCVLETHLLPEISFYHTDYTNDILKNIDVLVDGPFKKDLYDISLKFRGSRNQRILDMKTGKDLTLEGEKYHV